jgi:hypothetical protein
VAVDNAKVELRLSPATRALDRSLRNNGSHQVDDRSKPLDVIVDPGSNSQMR